jgi:hypothetical protein
MSSLLVFNIVYRLETQSIMLVFSTQLCEQTFSLVSPSSPSSPFPVCISILYMQHTGGGGGVCGHRRGRGPQTEKHLPQSPNTGHFLALLSISLIFLRST